MLAACDSVRAGSRPGGTPNIFVQPERQRSFTPFRARTGMFCPEPHHPDSFESGSNEPVTVLSPVLCGRINTTRFEKMSPADDSETSPYVTLGVGLEGQDAT